MQINQVKIATGESKTIDLNVARLPSGTLINIQVHVYRARKPGPVALVMGGLHGDEINGVEIVRRTLQEAWFSELQAGTVIVIPLLNIYGFINFSRDAVDGKDVNRSFPGSRKGSLASRVAATLTQQILPHIDFGVDFHTGGGSRYNYPQIRFSKGDAKAAQLAAQFRAPYILEKKSLDKTLRKTALDMNKPILVFEGGEALRYDGFSLENGLAGLRRLLVTQQMMSPAKGAFEQDVPLVFKKSSWLRAEQAGMFIWSQQSGAKVNKGERLGAINDPNGEEEIPVLAHRDGYIIGHNNTPVVNAGDGLFHIGYDLMDFQGLVK